MNKIKKIGHKIVINRKEIAKMTLFIFVFLTIVYGAYLSVRYLLAYNEAFYVATTYFENVLYIAFYLQYLVVFLFYILRYRQSKVLPLYLLACLVWFY